MGSTTKMKTPQDIRKRWNFLAKLNRGVLCGCVGFIYVDEKTKYGEGPCTEACDLGFWSARNSHSRCPKCNEDWYLPVGERV